MLGCSLSYLHIYMFLAYLIFKIASKGTSVLDCSAWTPNIDTQY